MQTTGFAWLAASVIPVALAGLSQMLVTRASAKLVIAACLAGDRAGAYDHRRHTSRAGKTGGCEVARQVSRLSGRQWITQLSGNKPGL